MASEKQKAIALLDFLEAQVRTALADPVEAKKIAPLSTYFDAGVKVANGRVYVGKMPDRSGTEQPPVDPDDPATWTAKE